MKLYVGPYYSTETSEPFVLIFNSLELLEIANSYIEHNYEEKSGEQFQVLNIPECSKLPDGVFSAVSWFNYMEDYYNDFDDVEYNDLIELCLKLIKKEDPDMYDVITTKRDLDQIGLL